MNFHSLSKVLPSLLILILAFPSQLIAQTKPVPRPSPKPFAASPSLESVITEISKMQPVEPRIKNPSNNFPDDKPPADNAPLEELLNYWQRHSYQSQDSKHAPSEIVSQRLLDACVNRPENCNPFLRLFPKTSTTFDALYQLVQETPESERQGLYQIKNYLGANSQYFREELLARAQIGRGGGLNELAQVDWDAAKPIIEKLSKSSDPTQAFEALRLSRQHALEVKDSAQAEMILARLKEIIANRQSLPYQRSMGIQMLMEDKWAGREDWFLSLFSDPTLTGVKPPETENPQPDRKNNTVSGAAVSTIPKAPVRDFSENMLARVQTANDDELVSKIIKLVESPDPSIHNATVSFLVSARRGIRYSQSSGKMEESPISQDITQALMPWLTNKNWAQVPGRGGFLYMLSVKPKPEYVPAMMSILADESEEDSVKRSAVSVLIGIDKTRFIPFFKSSLSTTKDELRYYLARLVYFENGFSDEEVVNGLEAFTRSAIAEEAKTGGRNREREMQNISLNELIGSVMNNGQPRPLTDGVILRILERVKELRPKEPVISQRLQARLVYEKNRIAQLNFLQRIRSGDVSSDSMIYALSEREEFQKNVSETLLSLVSEGGYVAGIASVILGENGRSQEILSGKDSKAQFALLVSARYLRDKLPVMEIMPLLSNPALVTVAENYLEMENSRAAREMIWSRHPNQAWIVGEAGEVIDGNLPGYSIPKGSSRKDYEKKLQAEVLASNEIVAVFAFIPPAREQFSPAIIVRVKKDEAEISLQNSKGYQKKRMLTSSELKELKSVLSQPEIEDLNPETYSFRNQYESVNHSEFLRINKVSGRRIILTNFRRAPKKDATPYEQLSGVFYSLMRAGDFKIRYDIEDKIKGVEVVYADEKNPIFRVGVEKKELRVFTRISDPTANPSEPRNPAQWYVFDGEKLGGVTTSPSLLAESFEVNNELAKIRQDGSRVARFLSVIPAKQIAYITKDSPTDDAGIFKFTFGGKPEKILSGNFYGLEVTTDEKWLVTTRVEYSGEASKSPYTLVRVNLQTKEEYLVRLTAVQGALYPHAPMPGGSKILLAPIQVGGSTESTKKSYWLDGRTGTLQEATGDLRPLLSKTFMPFQPSVTPNSYWVAFFDAAKGAGTFGLYNVENFTFKPVLELPKMEVSSTSIWADEAGGFVYLVHEGNLLRLPLK
jgi:hypothetical protein